MDLSKVFDIIDHYLILSTTLMNNNAIRKRGNIDWSSSGINFTLLIFKSFTNDTFLFMQNSCLSNYADNNTVYVLKIK